MGYIGRSLNTKFMFLCVYDLTTQVPKGWLGVLLSAVGTEAATHDLPPATAHHPPTTDATAPTTTNTLTDVTNHLPAAQQPPAGKQKTTGVSRRRGRSARAKSAEPEANTDTQTQVDQTEAQGEDGEGAAGVAQAAGASATVALTDGLQAAVNCLLTATKATGTQVGHCTAYMHDMGCVDGAWS